MLINSPIFLIWKNYKYWYLFNVILIGSALGDKIAKRTFSDPCLSYYYDDFT